MQRAKAEKQKREREKTKKKFYELCESVFERQASKFKKVETAVREMVAKIDDTETAKFAQNLFFGEDDLFNDVETRFKEDSLRLY